MVIACHRAIAGRYMTIWERVTILNRMRLSRACPTLKIDASA